METVVSFTPALECVLAVDRRNSNLSYGRRVLALSYSAPDMKNLIELCSSGATTLAGQLVQKVCACIIGMYIRAESLVHFEQLGQGKNSFRGMVNIVWARWYFITTTSGTGARWIKARQRNECKESPLRSCLVIRVLLVISHLHIASKHAAMPNKAEYWGASTIAPTRRILIAARHT